MSEVLAFIERLQLDLRQLQLAYAAFISGERRTEPLMEREALENALRRLSNLTKKKPIESFQSETFIARAEALLRQVDHQFEQKNVRIRAKLAARKEAPLPQETPATKPAASAAQGRKVIIASQRDLQKNASVLFDDYVRLHLENGLTPKVSLSKFQAFVLHQANAIKQKHGPETALTLQVIKSDDKIVLKSGKVHGNS
jgi:hypothetical protein